MTTGFVAVPRWILETDLWQKPAYYFKMFMYLYINAEFIDNESLKRGQVVADLEELVRVSESGTGSSKTGTDRRGALRFLKFLQNDDPRLKIDCESVAKGRYKISLLKYDALSNSKLVGCKTDDSGKTSTIIYNNDTNNKNVVKSVPKSVAKPTRFNNFAARERDYDEIKIKAREKLRAKAEELRNNENV